VWKDAVWDRRKVEFEEPCTLPPLLGAETSAAKDENHWISAASHAVKSRRLKAPV
jgi:hypothetical protein